HTLLREGKHSQALTELGKYKVEFPDSQEIDSLLEFTRSSIERSHREGAIDRALNDAKGKAIDSHFDDALGVLDHALAQYPGDARLLDLIRSITHAKAVHDKDRAFEQLRGRVSDASAGGRFPEALSAIDTVLAEYGDDEKGSLAALRDEVKEAQTAVWREGIVTTALKRAEEAAATRRFTTGITELERAIREAGDDVRLSAKLEQLQRASVLARTRAEVQRLETIGQYDKAVSVVEKALGEFPDDDELRTLHSALDKKAAEERRAEAIRRAQEEVREFLAKRDFDQAEAILEQFGQQTDTGTTLTELRQEIEQSRAIAGAMADASRLLSLDEDAEALSVLEGVAKQFPTEETLHSRVRQVRRRIA
ncbi:MAG TPA: hypothetical protein PKI99_09530, partial [Terrimesophilobacter sp.]|nr:hypothetical protein [Terrimesophilobacter sp.]